MNSFVVYKLDKWSRDLKTDFIVSNSLFRVPKLPNNGDPGNTDIVVMVLMHV